MRKIALALFAAGAVVATEAGAQVIVRASAVPPGQRPPDGMCRVWINDVAPGRQPRPTDCATAHATAPLNSRIIYGADAAFPGRATGRLRNDDCDFERRRSNLGDVFVSLGTRSRTTYDCRADASRIRQQGVWYPISRDASGNVIYERRVRDRSGRTVVERARSRDGRTLEHISSKNSARTVRHRDRDDDDDDRRMTRAQRDRERAVREREKTIRKQQKAIERASRDREKALRKAQKEREKAIERARRDVERRARGRDRG